MMSGSKSFSLFFWLAMIALAIVYALGMPLDLMDVDAAQYGLISKTMFLSRSYLEVMVGGKDYLDKPPLLFWTACLSFKVFGIHDWAYRIPSALCFFLGIYSLYRFTKLFYDEYTAKIAALIMASCLAACLMLNDVRTDTMLTGWVMFSIWQLAEFNRSLRFKNIALGSLGIGLAMLTKGPIGMLIPVTAFSSEFIYKKQWGNFFRWQYIPAVLIIALVLLPMSYGLYEQFDLHPEKSTYGIKSPSGLKFFYWTQSFGRITGEITIKNDPDPFFLVHSFLWSFLPWTVFFIPAFYTNVVYKIRAYKNPINKEFISMGGFSFVFIFLSLSKYQLPHYIFVLFPLAAVITADYLNRNFLSFIRTRMFSVAFGIHIFVMFAMYALALVLVNLVFPSSLLYTVFIFCSLLGFLFILCYSGWDLQSKVISCTVIPFVTLAMILNIHFYPHLLSFQNGSQVARDINKISGEDGRILIFKNNPTISMDFYTKLPITSYVDEKTMPGYLIKGKTYILTDSTDSKTIQGVIPGIQFVKNYYGFSVTQLNADFLNPSKRNTTLEKQTLLRY
jgi:4-amino-4-deoxy-L-arabinose transferase-like glycosyltransferase